MKLLTQSTFMGGLALVLPVGSAVIVLKYRNKKNFSVMSNYGYFLGRCFIITNYVWEINKQRPSNISKSATC